jgi:hypothetical protein
MKNATRCGPNDEERQASPDEPPHIGTFSASNVLRMSGAHAHWDESSSRRPLDALVRHAMP